MDEKELKKVVFCVDISETNIKLNCSLTSYIVNAYRETCASDFTGLVLSEDDQMISLQLCLAEINKHETGEFDVEISTVLDMYNHLQSYKLGLASPKLIIDEDKFSILSESYSTFLSRCNCIDLMDVWLKVKEAVVAESKIVISCLPKSKLEEHVLEELCRGRTMVSVSETGEETVCESLEEGLSRLVSAAPQSPVSVTEDYIRGIYLSYIQLLVNTRCELALARVFNVPDRELDQTAFTDLRKVAADKRLSMCQTAVSHVMCLRLGGKSYRPDPDSPLGKNIKGLAELVDLLHKLQTVVEEEMNTKAAVEKVIRIIRTALFRCKTNSIRRETVEKVSTRLEEEVAAVIEKVSGDSAKGPTPDKKSSDGGSARGRQTAYVLRQLLDQDASRPCRQRAVNILGDAFSTQRTPVRFPSIMSKFRSPELVEEEEGEDRVLSLSDRLGLSQRSQKPVAVPRYGACMDWVDPSTLTRDKDDHIFSEEELKLLNKTSALTISSQTLMSPPSKVSETKSKLIRVPAESRHDQENLLEKSPAPAPQKRKRNRDTATSPAQKRVKKAPAAKKTKKAVVPAKGQKRLTDFFRM